ncbi:hypothetical protein FA09DRAFT_202793 [Tilletiopsis washingtonensis]|uniref:Uncharacterized protein n=1 Tax=Tilletiopsis washingtonensis TaxID=58919 RepID=A0A316ZES8_9BASI|nr:hypothetical protein FA09DRAFT_202793 [Tilletiopsis washingtonensis]PWO00032.1 hypothetical protein FA09DRAFT_202793 [Tilletiopsis washingtonensis]
MERPACLAAGLRGVCAAHKGGLAVPRRAAPPRERCPAAPERPPAAASTPSRAMSHRHAPARSACQRLGRRFARQAASLAVHQALPPPPRSRVPACARGTRCGVESSATASCTRTMCLPQRRVCSVSPQQTHAEAWAPPDQPAERPAGWEQQQARASGI